MTDTFQRSQRRGRRIRERESRRRIRAAFARRICASRGVRVSEASGGIQTRRGLAAVVRRGESEGSNERRESRPWRVRGNKSAAEVETRARPEVNTENSTGAFANASCHQLFR